jgi:hypothetical protein
MAMAPAAIPYDVAVTPAPPNAPEPTPPTPRVCTCGYDLAGLPASQAAKCPECGANAQAAALASVTRARNRAAAIMAFGPTALAVVSLPAALWPGGPVLPYVMAWVGTIVAMLWLFTVTPLICVGWVQVRFGWLPDWYQGPLALAVAAAVIAVNIGVSAGFIALARALFF